VTGGLEITTVSTFVPVPIKPANPDPPEKVLRHHCRLVELTKQAFPDVKVLDPFVVALWSSLSGDVAPEKLLFILVSGIVVTNAACHRYV